MKNVENFNILQTVLGKSFDCRFTLYFSPTFYPFPRLVWAMMENLHEYNDEDDNVHDVDEVAGLGNV